MNTPMTNSTPLAIEHDVVIVGAGPTGLMLAFELTLHGVDVAILERDTVRSGQSKALNLQPRSAEVLHSRGLLDPLLELAADRIGAGHFAGLPVALDYSVLDTRFPFQLGIPQARIEELLEDRLLEDGVPILRGVTLTSLTQGDGGMVHATAEGPAGTVAVTARYLVGCDGAPSATRKLSGIGFPGRDGRFRAAVADIAVDDHRPGAHDRWELPRIEPSVAGSVTLLALEQGTMRILFAGPRQQRLPLDAPV